MSKDEINSQPFLSPMLGVKPMYLDIGDPQNPVLVVPGLDWEWKYNVPAQMTCEYHTSPDPDCGCGVLVSTRPQNLLDWVDCTETIGTYLPLLSVVQVFGDDVVVDDEESLLYAQNMLYWGAVITPKTYNKYTTVIETFLRKYQSIRYYSVIELISSRSWNVSKLLLYTTDIDYKPTEVLEIDLDKLQEDVLNSVKKAEDLKERLRVENILLQSNLSDQELEELSDQLGEIVAKNTQEYMDNQLIQWSTVVRNTDGDEIDANVIPFDASDIVWEHLAGQELKGLTEFLDADIEWDEEDDEDDE